MKNLLFFFGGIAVAYFLFMKKGNNGKTAAESLGSGFSGDYMDKKS